MDFLLPKLSSTMETAKVSRWYKAAGDSVKMGENLVEIETDKAALDVESPVDGVVEALIAEPGAELEIGALLARLRTKDDAAAQDKATQAPAKEAPRPVAPAGAAQAPAAPSSGAARPAPPRLLASPLAKRLAGLHAVDLSSLKGSGPQGRIRKRDVLAAAEAKAREASPPQAAHTTAAPAAEPAAPMPFAGGAEPLSPMRSRIAASVTLSRQTIPSFVLDRWVETAALTRARDYFGEEVEQAGGIRLTFTDFLLQALADCLAQAPHMLDRYVEEGGRPARIRTQAVDIGLVVAVPEGVMIPVLHDLAGKPLAAVAAARQAAVQRARSGRLAQADYAPYSIALSNVGRAGADRFEAIIGPGQSSILAIGREHEKVVARSGAIAIASGVNLTLSVDHRLIDGVVGAEFLGQLADRIQLGPWTAR